MPQRQILLVMIASLPPARFGGQGFAAAGQTAHDGDGDAAGVIEINVGGNVTPVLNGLGTIR